MKVQASGLQLRNIGQLAQVTLDGVTIMGRLDGVAFRGDGDYILSIGRQALSVPADHSVIIRRSANLDALVNISDGIDDGLEADNAA